MILTCPNCATDFFVDDHLIGAGGRRVKCDECGEVWTAGGPPPTVEPEPWSRAEPHAAPPVAEPEPETAPAVSAWASPPPPAPEPESPMFAAPRSPPPPRRTPFPWRRLAIGFLIVLALVAIFVVYQKNISRISPAAESVYRSLGLGHSPAQSLHG